MSAGGTRTWPAQDPLGSVAAILNGSGAATQINTYDEYGVPGPGFSGPFGYAGSMHLSEAGAAPWHMRNRQYHPALGRFLQTDPIGYAGGMNLYAYVGGDPVNAVDPWGLQEDNPGDVDVVCANIPGCESRYRWGRGMVRWRNVDGGYSGTDFLISRDYEINGVPGSVSATCTRPPGNHADPRATAAGMIADAIGTTAGVVRSAGSLGGVGIAGQWGAGGVLVFGTIGAGAEVYQEVGQIRSELDHGVDSRVVWGGAFARWSSTAAVSTGVASTVQRATRMTDSATRGLGSNSLGAYAGLLTSVVWTGSGADQAVGRATQEEILESLGY